MPVVTQSALRLLCCYAPHVPFPLSFFSSLSMSKKRKKLYFVNPILFSIKTRVYPPHLTRLNASQKIQGNAARGRIRYHCTPGSARHAGGSPPAAQNSDTNDDVISITFTSTFMIPQPSGMLIPSFSIQQPAAQVRTESSLP